jgi:hypothetical protein
MAFQNFGLLMVKLVKWKSASKRHGEVQIIVVCLSMLLCIPAVIVCDLFVSLCHTLPFYHLLYMDVDAYVYFSHRLFSSYIVVLLHASLFLHSLFPTPISHRVR